MGIFRRRSDRRDDRGTAGPGFRILDLNAAELAWVDDLRRSLPGSGGVLDPGAIGSLHDDALTAWSTAPTPTRDDPNIMINALGVAVGDVVCARVPGARWATVADSEGTELAVVVRPPDGPVIFPANAVAKRWSAGERGWVPGFIESTVERLIELTTDPSPQVRGLASFALAHAVDSIVPDGGPLIPFCLLETAEGRSLDRFLTEELSEGVARAREHVRGSGAIRAAVAWDGYLTTEGRREDALFVEASDAAQPSVVMAHRYVQTRHGAQAVGGPLVVGHGASLL